MREACLWPHGLRQQRAQQVLVASSWRRQTEHGVRARARRAAQLWPPGLGPQTLPRPQRQQP